MTPTLYGELPEIETTLATGEPGPKVNGYPVQEPTSEKLCILRLPTNTELSVYMTAQRFHQRDMGRRTSETEVIPTPKADLVLFTALRLDKSGPEWDDAEIEYALSIVLQHRVQSVDKDGKTYVVTIGTLFGQTVHTLNIPSRKDLRDYRNGASKSRNMPNGIEEIRLPPDAPAMLYDKLKVTVTGYADGFEVPINHKRTVMSEISNALALLDPGIDPN